jgi:hypothetical protein
VLAAGGDMTHDALAMIEYRSDPAVFILGDSAAAIARWRPVVEAQEIRVAGTGEIGSECLPAANMPLLIDVEQDSASLHPVFRLLEREAETRDRRAAIVVTPELIDLAMAAIRHPNIQLACNASAADRAADLAAILAPRADRLNDVGRDGHEVLRRLSEEAGRLATMLANLAETEAGELVKPDNGEESEHALEPAAIRAIIRARRLRGRYFADALFADPAWDMLLDLMAARLENVPVAVSSLCIASAVPATTALRWIRTLTENGLFVRIADPHDGRRVFIGLSDQAARSLAAYLSAVQRLTPTPV